MGQNVVFFNELSVQDAIESNSAPKWANTIQAFSEIAANSLKIKNGLNFGFPNDSLYLTIHGKSLLDHLRGSMQKSAFLLFITRAKQYHTIDAPKHIQAWYETRESIGVLFAISSLNTTAFGCLISLNIDGLWSESAIEIDLAELVADDITFSKQKLPHISCADHIEQWRDRIIDWGEQVATNWKIWELDGMPVVMYPGPLEHPPPHIHLLDPNGSRRTIAKYLVEPFERAKGPRTWDSEMRTFVEQNREKLIRSWELCQNGKKPIAI